MQWCCGRVSNIPIRGLLIDSIFAFIIILIDSTPFDLLDFTLVHLAPLVFSLLRVFFLTLLSFVQTHPQTLGMISGILVVRRCSRKPAFAVHELATERTCLDGADGNGRSHWDGTDFSFTSGWQQGIRDSKHQPRS